MANPYLIKAMYPSGARAPAPSVQYKLPTVEELRKSDVQMEVEAGKVERIAPIEKLSNRIEDFLPPSGACYDYYALNDVFSKAFWADGPHCTSCWSVKHVQSPRDCEFECVICQTKEHLGKECFALYVPKKFWRDGGHTPQDGTVQIRPNASQLAYLIVAGVVQPSRRLKEPIVVNMKNPIVHNFYKGRAEPEYLIKREKVHQKQKKMESALITPTANAAPARPVPPPNPAPARVPRSQTQIGGNIVDIERDPRLMARTTLPQSLLHLENHSKCEEEVQELKKTRDEMGRELEKAQDKMKEKDCRIAELERVLREMRSMADGALAGVPGDKRRRQEDDVGGRRVE